MWINVLPSKYICKIYMYWGDQSGLINGLIFGWQWQILAKKEDEKKKIIRWTDRNTYMFIYAITNTHINIYTHTYMLIDGGERCSQEKKKYMIHRNSTMERCSWILCVCLCVCVIDGGGGYTGLCMCQNHRWKCVLK